MMSNIGEGATPLMYACQQSREKEVLDILARKPKSVRDRDRTLKTPLHYCAENTNTGCAEAILRVAPELLDAKDEDGYTALHLAVIAGNKLLLRLLISRGANVNALDNEKHTAVHWATVCGEQEALEMLLRAGANISIADIHGGYPLHYAAQMCGPGSEMGGDPRIGLSVLRALLSYGVDINVQDKDGRQPILWAASADAQSRDPGARFAASGSADAILALVNAGASVEAADKDGLTALHCAASRGHTDCLETLVALCGANVDVIDSNGCTALFYAVTLGHADSTQLLLTLGAEPNRQDRKGRTPAHCGAAKGQLETLRILLNHAANLWLRNVKGDFPLHEAVASGRRDLVRWLLNQRPDATNVANNDGRCPIHVAAMNNNVEIIKILFDYQSLVNPIMRTSKGVFMTPLDAALHRGNRSCAKYLQLHGGVPFSKLTEASSNLRGTSSRQVVPEPQLGVSDGLQHTRYPLNTLSTGLATSSLDQGRMNDDLAIQHVERIEMPNENESSGGEEERTYRRRRRRRRSDQRKKDYISEEDSDSDDRSQDSRTRPRRKRKESEEDDRKSRRRKKSEESGSDDGRRRKKGHDSSYESEEEEDNYRVRRKKHYSVSEDSEIEESKKKSKRENGKEEEKKIEEEKKQAVEVDIHSEPLPEPEPEVGKEIADTVSSNQHVEEPIIAEEVSEKPPEAEKEVTEQEEESISKEEPTVDEAKEEEGEEEKSEMYEDEHVGRVPHGFEEEERVFYRSEKKPQEMYAEEEIPQMKKEETEDLDESFNRKGSLKRQQVNSSRKRRSYMTKTESEERDEMVSRMGDVDTVIKGVRLGDADGRSTSMGDDSGGSTRNEDSSVLLDSGIEPSPRRGRKLNYELPDQRDIETAGSRRSRVPRLCRKGKNEDDDEPVHTISVTQAVQNTIRKYHMERRIFYQLLELKRLQIRAGRSNEHVLVKRLIDEYKRAGLIPGLKYYNGSYTFKQFEHFLYDQLHSLQSTGQVLIPNLKPSDDIETLATILKKTRVQLLDDIPDNPILCTHGTHRCFHAAHAYTGIPCAAYITKLSHHEMPKTRNSSSFLPRIDPSPSSRPSSKRMTIRPVTLELTHGTEKQVISLPTENLDKNKRYYVTFTIKGAPTPEDSRPESTREEVARHRHAKSF